MTRKEIKENNDLKRELLLMHLVLLITVQVMHQVYKVYLFLILNISRFADLTKLNYLFYYLISMLIFIKYLIIKNIILKK